MKRFLIAGLAAALCASVAMAALDLYDGANNIEISTLKVATGVQTNAAVSTRTAKGICNLLVYIGPATTNAADFGANATLKTSATSGGTYVTVTNGSGSAVTVTGFGVAGTGVVTSVKIEAERLRAFCKLFTVATNDTCVIGANLLCPK